MIFAGKEQQELTEGEGTRWNGAEREAGVRRKGYTTMR